MLNDDNLTIDKEKFYRLNLSKYGPPDHLNFQILNDKHLERECKRLKMTKNEFLQNSKEIDLSTFLSDYMYSFGV